MALMFANMEIAYVKIQLALKPIPHGPILGDGLLIVSPCARVTEFKAHTRYYTCNKKMFNYARYS